MPDPHRLLLEAIDRSLRIEVQGAHVTPIGTGFCTGWRTLPGCTTAHVVDISICLELPGGPPVTLRPGESFCLPPSLHHRSTVTSGTGLSRWSLFECMIFGSVPALSLVDLPLVLHGRKAQRLGDLNAALATELHHPAPGLQSTIRKQALAFAVVGLLLADAPLRPHAEALLLHAKRLAPVLDHLERHLAAPVSRQGLARIAGLSPSRFHALFTAAMGMSPLAYALQRRLQLASHQLVSSDLSVQDIATRMGFSDPFYFSRLFRQRMQLSPSAYRRAARHGLSPG